MLSEDFTISPFPGVEAVDCGALTVHWLRPSVPLGDDDVARGLHADERAHAATLKAPTRRAEYERSRYLLRRLTGFTGALPRTPFGGPAWPPGLIGSLTHKDGYVGLVLAPAGDWGSVGVDAEDLARLKPEFEERVCRPADSALLDRLTAATGLARTTWLGLVFSFKEALFKCHHPLGGKMFYFHDAELTDVDPESRVIRARVLTPTSPVTPQGHESEGHFAWWRGDGRQLVVTTVTLPPRRR